MDYAALTVRREGDRFILIQRVCKDAEQGGKESVEKLAGFEPSERQTIIYYPRSAVGLFAGTSGRRRDCAVCIQSRRSDVYSLWQAVQSRQQVDSAKVGFVCVEPHAEPAVNRGWMDVDWFRVTP